MKKNNSYLADDEIDLGDLIKSLWREKILILSISIICGLAGYLYTSFEPQHSRTEIRFKNPPASLFEPYNYLLNINNNSSNINNIINNNSVELFISNFKLNFLSLDSLVNYIEESRNHNKFKEYLKSKNISPKKYFIGKVEEKKVNNKIIDNTFLFLFEPKYLEGDIFINNYAEFVKKKTTIEFKKNLKLVLENRIYYYEQGLEIAKLINLEYPIVKTPNNQQLVNEPEAIFYKGSKVLEQNLVQLKKLLQKLETDQFNHDLIIDKASPSSDYTKTNILIIFISFIFGFLISLIVVFLKSQIRIK